MQSIESPRQSAVCDRGTVFKKSQGQYAVQAAGRTFACELSNVLRKELIYPISAACKHPASDPVGCPRCRPGGNAHRSVRDVGDIQVVDPVSIGDTVHFLPIDDEHGMITEVLPRRNKLGRRAAGVKPLEQVIVANADQMVPVVAAAKPAPSWELLDRYLAAAEEAELPACIVITKMDLVDEDACKEEIHAYRKIGYTVIPTSSASGDGIDEVKRALSGRMSVVAGKSGVGKTTLLNAVQPGLGLRVGEVSKLTGKGKHTTSHLEMFELDGGGAIVDTPGMREFGLWNVSREEVGHFFPEIRPVLGTCRFGLDCAHVHEPGCAVKQGVEEGRITERRYRSFLRIGDSL